MNLDKYKKDQKIFEKNYEAFIKSCKKDELTSENVIDSLLVSVLVTTIYSFNDTKQFGEYLKLKIQLANDIVTKIRENEK